MKTKASHLVQIIAGLSFLALAATPAIADLKVGLERNKVWYLVQLLGAVILIVKAFKWI